MQTVMHARPKQRAWAPILTFVVICLVGVGVLGLIALIRTANFAVNAAAEPALANANQGLDVEAARGDAPQLNQATAQPLATPNVSVVVLRQEPAVDAGSTSSAAAPAPAVPPPVAANGQPFAQAQVAPPPQAPPSPNGTGTTAIPLAQGQTAPTDAGITSSVDAGVGSDAGDAGIPDASPQAAELTAAERLRMVTDVTTIVGSMSCGPNTCNVGQVCCNPSCGICAAPGAKCDTRVCGNAIQNPGESQACGMTTCNVGMVCCNASCGTCAPPGQECSTEICS